jgi:hypothetical protein
LGNPDRKCIQRIVLAALGPEPIREPQKIFLVNRVAHFHYGPLDDFILQRRNPERTLLSIRFRDELAPRR